MHLHRERSSCNSKANSDLDQRNDRYLCFFFPAGTCLDRINNFSCVCNVGYTGRHCDVITNKCTNYSCYPGVSCMDKTVPISCGTCPPGFTGNGKSCKGNNNSGSMNTLGFFSLLINGEMEGILESREDISKHTLVADLHVL